MLTLSYTDIFMVISTWPEHAWVFVTRVESISEFWRTGVLLRVSNSESLRVYSPDLMKSSGVDGGH